MTDVHDLVYDWARRHCPALLENELLLDELSYFVVQIVDFTILATRRQVMKELNDAKLN